MAGFHLGPPLIPFRPFQLESPALALHPLRPSPASAPPALRLTAAPQLSNAPEFVFIPRPTERAITPWRPRHYRVTHRTERWRKGEKSTLVQQVVEGNADLSV